MRKLGDTDVFNKTVALRVDLNVPIENGEKTPETKEKVNKSKTVAEVDRDKLEKKFASKKEEKLN